MADLKYTVDVDTSRAQRGLDGIKSTGNSGTNANYTAFDSV